MPPPLLVRLWGALPLGIVRTQEFELEPWQASALSAWERGDDKGPYRGTLEIVTGGGKTLIALEAFARATVDDDRFRLAVVVPTEALAHQWREAVVELTSVDRDDVALLGAGESGSLRKSRVVISVLNSAAKYLPADAAEAQGPLMLVVDECHRAGAPIFSAVLQTPAERRLGLSATPDRQDVDEDGLPIDYDAHALGRALGPVVYRFGLKEARSVGWLPSFTLHHHAVTLEPDEREQYESWTRKIEDLAETLAGYGIEPWQARRLVGGSGEVASVASGYEAAVASRKDLLYRSRERGRVAARLVTDALGDGAVRVLLFHERVAEVDRLAAALRNDFGVVGVGVEHSALPTAERRRAIADFRTGEIRVLVSARSLIEGINVPDADVGISVAASSSVRQRVQSLGRVLRRGSGSKNARMHMLYVGDTSDDAIYGKEDWSDLTGPDANRYWRWGVGALVPEPLSGPPKTPRALEEAEWERHGRVVVEPPAEWLGVIPEAEYTVDALGNVRTPAGTPVANPQGVGAMLRRVGRDGGRFRVTPLHQVVLASTRKENESAFVVIGRLGESFTPWIADVEDRGVDAAPLVTGDPYTGPRDKAGGTYLLKQIRGGVIARRRKDGMDFAITDSEACGDRARNARLLLGAWRTLGGGGRPLYVDSDGRAWIEAEGRATFLADVPGGFCFGNDEPEDGATHGD